MKATGAGDGPERRFQLNGPLHRAAVKAPDQLVGNAEDRSALRVFPLVEARLKETPQPLQPDRSPVEAMAGFV
jgi:hypothetical protein